MRDQLQPTFSTCIDLPHQKHIFTRIINSHSLTLHQTVFSQLWLTRVFLTSPCHRLQLQLIPSLFRTTVTCPCLHRAFTLSAHLSSSPSRNKRTEKAASSLHHSDLKRCNVRGVKSPAGEATRSCVNVSDQSP